ncbi:MAG TPA: hypothetical protein PKW90_09840 [Myxococcota bacterium]|nr:hypothetical protein [Myxococcota bacterium]
MVYPFSRFRFPARSSSHTEPNTCGQKGFNLIEAAIVLGVVGLVIGGIWVAASAVTNSRRNNETISGVLTAVDQLKKLYPLGIVGSINTYITPTATQMASMDVFPRSWYVPGPFPVFDKIVPPIGKNASIVMNGSYCAPRSPTCSHQHTSEMAITFVGGKDSCIKVALAFDQQVGKSLDQITINSSTVPSPLSTAQAAAACVTSFNTLSVWLSFD